MELRVSESFSLLSESLTSSFVECLDHRVFRPDAGPFKDILLMRMTPKPMKAHTSLLIFILLRSSAIMHSYGNTGMK
jgi:hypothetical protein